MQNTSRIRILTTCANDSVVRHAATAFHRSAVVDQIGADTIRRLEPAECLVVDTAEHARVARATGFEGAIIVVAAPAGEDEEAAFLSQGTHFALPAGGSEGLASTLHQAISFDSDGAAKRVEALVARTRRLLAAGEIAVGLRHALNNPLTALMAELQLLHMDARETETRAALERMLELVRRLTELTRALESVNDRPGGL